MSIHGHRLDLEETEKSCLHERSKSLIKDVRAVSFALQLAKTLDDITGLQPSETAHSYAVKVVNWSRCDDDLHRHSFIHCLIRRGGRVDFYVEITTRLVICLDPPWDIGDTRIGIRPLQEIEYLPAQRFGIVNCLPGKGDTAEKILPALVNRDDHVHLIGLVVKDITRRIDNRVQKTFRNVKAMGQVCSLLHVRSNER